MSAYCHCPGHVAPSSFGCGRTRLMQVPTQLFHDLSAAEERHLKPRPGNPAAGSRTCLPPPQPTISCSTTTTLMATNGTSLAPVGLVTGGASGMGLSVVKRLVELKWNVTIVDLNESAGLKVAGELGPQVLFVQADITHYDQLTQAFVQTWQKWHRLDFVFANAVTTSSKQVTLMWELTRPGYRRSYRLLRSG